MSTTVAQAIAKNAKNADKDEKIVVNGPAVIGPATPDAAAKIKKIPTYVSFTLKEDFFNVLTAKAAEAKLEMGAYLRTTVAKALDYTLPITVAKAKSGKYAGLSGDAKKAAVKKDSTVEKLLAAKLLEKYAADNAKEFEALMATVTAQVEADLAAKASKAAATPAPTAPAAA